MASQDVKEWAFDLAVKIAHDYAKSSDHAIGTVAVVLQGTYDKLLSLYEESHKP